MKESAAWIERVAVPFEYSLSHASSHRILRVDVSFCGGNL
jgi:hypothetical protein